MGTESSTKQKDPTRAKGSINKRAQTSGRVTYSSEP